MTSARRKLGERRAEVRRDRYLLLALLVVSLLAAVYGTSQLARFKASLQTAQQQLKDMQQEQESLQQRLRRQQIELLLAEQSADEQRDMVKDLEQQLFHQQQTLARYQSALRPDAMRPGLRIQAFELHPAAEPGSYRFRVMVSRVGSEEDEITGRLSLRIQGLQAGEPAELRLPDEEPGFAFGFRYFQVLPEDAASALLHLPEGFEPLRVHVRASTTTGSPVQRSFDWRAPAAAEPDAGSAAIAE